MIAAAQEDFAAIAAGRLNPNAMPGEPGQGLPAETETQAVPVAVRPMPEDDPKAHEQKTESDKPAKTNAQEERELTNRLAWLIRERASASEDPAQAALTLAMLESIQPDLLADLDRDEGLGRLLAPSEVEAVAAMRRIARKGGEAADPGRLADLLEDEARALASTAGVRVSDAALCSRVTGYGRYELLPSATFVRGRPPRMIVYTEIDRFAHRDSLTQDNSSSSDRWAVELTQELKLYVDGTDHEATWSQAPQRVVQTSRRKIRDLFLVQEVTLPANLSLGSYSLHIRVTDTTNGSSDERVIPLRIVAQPLANK